MSLSESQPYTVALPGAAVRRKRRELELYRGPDKDSSHCQVSRTGQLNTESDPSTRAHPWEREIEEGRMGRREAGRSQGLFLKVEALRQNKTVTDKQNRTCHVCKHLRLCIMNIKGLFIHAVPSFMM